MIGISEDKEDLNGFNDSARRQDFEFEAIILAKLFNRFFLQEYKMTFLVGIK